MQKVMLAGRVANPRLNTVNGRNGAVSVLNFSLACKSDKKGQDGKPLTDWWDCAVWGKYAETMSQHLTKGTSLSAIGVPGAEMYQKNGQNHVKQTCNIDTLTLLGGGEQNQQQFTAQQNAQPAQQQNNGMAQQNQNPMMASAPTDFEDDDCPF